MSSAEEDLTARARIRDAAIELFAEKGINGATIREIADRAKVSSGLLRHHFGSKEGLRDACDEYAMGRLGELRQQMYAGKMGDRSFMGVVTPMAMAMQAYLVQSMVANPTPHLFRMMVGAGEQWLPTTPLKTDDPTAFSAALVAMQIGLFLMRDRMTEIFGVDTRSPEGHARLLKATVEIFSQTLLTPEQAEQAKHMLGFLTEGEEKP